MGLGLGWRSLGGLPVWPEMAIPTLKHKGLGYVGDPTSGGDPRMGGGNPRIYKKSKKSKVPTLEINSNKKNNIIQNNKLITIIDKDKIIVSDDKSSLRRQV